MGDWLFVRCGDELVPRQVTEISRLENVQVVQALTMNHHIVVSGVHASVHAHNDRVMRIRTWGLRKRDMGKKGIFKAFN